MTAFLVWVRVLLTASAAVGAGQLPLRSGDVVLQASQSGMSETIRRATASPYSHVGLVEVTAEGTFVLEAISPVSRTPWAAWRARGRGAKVTVLRSTLDDDALRRVVDAARAHLGKPYDPRYGWGDEAIYCSELVVKAFEQGAHLAVGQPQRLESLALSAADLRLAKKLKVSLSQTVVTPESLARDATLTRMYSDF